MHMEMIVDLTFAFYLCMSTAKHGLIFRFGLDIDSQLKRRLSLGTIQILTCILRKHVRGPWYFYALSVLLNATESMKLRYSLLD